MCVLVLLVLCLMQYERYNVSALIICPTWHVQQSMILRKNRTFLYIQQSVILLSITLYNASQFGKKVVSIFPLDKHCGANDSWSKGVPFYSLILWDVKYVSSGYCRVVYMTNVTDVPILCHCFVRKAGTP